MGFTILSSIIHLVFVFGMFGTNKIMLVLLFLTWISFMFATGHVELSWNENTNFKLGLTQKVKTITFLITVNDTWDENGCIFTVKTPPLVEGKKSAKIMVGTCDQGPLEFNVNPANDNKNLMTVDLIFHSSVIVDASPPTCSILWNGTYLVPPNKQTSQLPSLLPGCRTADSREGYHMTYYWFYLLDWEFE